MSNALVNTRPHTHDRQPITLSDTFCKQLLQLSGFTMEKALAIISIYRTPSM